MASSGEGQPLTWVYLQPPEGKQENYDGNGRPTAMAPDPPAPPAADPYQLHTGASASLSLSVGQWLGLGEGGNLLQGSFPSSSQ